MQLLQHTVTGFVAAGCDNDLLNVQVFQSQGIQPYVVAEFEDSALLKVFGQNGVGIFAAPSVIEDELCKHYHVKVVGSTDEVKECFYAITIERRIKNPAVVAISEAARSELFRPADST